MGWLIYLLLAVLVSGIVGWHISQFQYAAGASTGMMAGLTMGLLNGLVIGYAGAAALGSVFWGNLFGSLLGLVLGISYGRTAGLLGMMSGALGGVVAGALGAILASIVGAPAQALVWTATLLAAVYVLGMLALIVLVEQQTPEFGAYHRLAPLFARGDGADVEEEEDSAPAPPPVSSPVVVPAAPPVPRPRRLVDFYAFLAVPSDADEDAILSAYQARIADADPATIGRAEHALAVLTDPAQRAAYDQALAENRAALAAFAGPPPGATGRSPGYAGSGGAGGRRRR